MRRKYLFLIPLLLLIVSCDKGDDTSPPKGDPLPAPVLVDVNNEEKEVAKDGDIVKIFHLNDTHGAIEYLPEVGEPGMSRIAGYISDKRQEEQTSVILVSSGDMFQGSLDSNVSQGRLMLDIMKEMKFDGMTIGNHEFDWGLEVLRENATYAMNDNFDWSFPFLAGNILGPNNEYEFGYLSTTFNRGPARVSIIGSTDATVYSSVDSTIIKDYKFDRQTTVVVNEAKRLRKEGSDLIIYSTHKGGLNIDKKILNEVDAVFTGHTHIDSIQDTTKNKNGQIVPVIESGDNGRLIGEVNFIYNATKEAFELSEYQNIELSEPYLVDEGVETIYNTYLDAPVKDGLVEAESLSALKTDVIGEITNDSIYALNGRIDVKNVRKMFLHAQLEKFQASDGVIASFHNESRCEWNVGSITYSDIFKAFPFDSATLIVEVSGQQLKKWNLANVSILEGSIDNVSLYKVVTSTYITNNYVFNNYQRIIKEESELFQRHIFYEAFKNAETANPWG